MTTLGILASGRGSNCEAILDAVEAGSVPARVVLVASDQPGAPVLSAAKSKGVPARFIEPGRTGARLTDSAEDAFVTALKDAGAEWVVLAGFMRIVGARLLEAFPQRIVNIHPSLLPAFPGLDAQGQAWEYGVKVTGATVHFVDRGVDTGPIVMQAPVPVHAGDTRETLSARILQEEHRLYPRALHRLFTKQWRLESRRFILSEEKNVP